MAVNVREKTIEGIEAKLGVINTDLTKIAYLESALKCDFGLEEKRYLWSKLAELYGLRKMFEKAGKAMGSKASVDITIREKIESYLRAGEFFAKASKMEDSEYMFMRAFREANSLQKERIKLAMKNIFLISARELEKSGKKASSAKFYERIIKMNLDDIERKEVKEKLKTIYTSIGKFREAKLLEGL